MPNLLRKEYSILKAKSLIDALSRTSPSAESLYAFIGKTDPWADDNSPDTPTQDITDEFLTRGGMIGLKKINSSDLAFVIPRVNWTSGTVYDEYDADDALLSTKSFYVMNSNRNVYKCLNNNNGANSVIEPTGTSTASFSTGDGYTWKFMFNLSSTVTTKFLTSDYIPVPYSGQKTSQHLAVESAATYSAGTPKGGHGADAIAELFATRLMITTSFDADEDGVLITNDDFRQYGLLLNPRLVSTNAIATGNVYSMNDTDSDINENTGMLLYVNNRKPAQRNADQSEDIKIIIAL